MATIPTGVGMYQLACEASPHRIQIDTWLNEGLASTEISRRLLAQFGEKISDRSVMKYKKYREHRIQEELKKDPQYMAKMNSVQDELNAGIGKIKEVDLIGKLSTAIEDSAELLAQAKAQGIAIRNMQDYRFVSQTMLDAIKIYGDTMLKAQKMQKIEDDPSLLKPTSININVKSALIDMLSGAIGQGDYGVIDKLREGIGMSADVVDVNPDDLKNADEDGEE